MNTFYHLSEALRREQKIEVEWSAAAGAAPVLSLYFPDGTFYEFPPDAGRQLGLALVEASGLALGAWGAQQAAEAQDV